MNMQMPGTMGGARTIFDMPKLNSIGIIGLGYVGMAIEMSLNFGWKNDNVYIDSYTGHTGTYEEIAECSGVFVCVPTPQNEIGECDSSILEDVLTKLSDVNYQGVIISKCTATPNIYQRLNAQYPNLVHCPEFLTAANASRDYENATWTIIGGEITAWRNEAERIIKLTQSNLKTVKFCKIGEAALAKYAVNSFLATKVVFMNELYQIANKAGLNYNIVANLVKQDDRIGPTHMNVPGLDGVLGFGGKCFPKDTNTMLKYAEGLGITPMVLETVVKKNAFLRLTEPK